MFSSDEFEDSAARKRARTYLDAWTRQLQAIEDSITLFQDST